MLTDDLLDLQRVDSGTDQLTYRRAHLPERSAADAAGAALRATRKRIEAVLARQRELTAAIEQAEHEGAELTRHRERLQAQLRTVIAPREAEALMRELDTFAERRDQIDDQELANLEEQSQLVDELTELHAAEKDQAAAEELAARALAEAEAALDDETAELTVQRSEVVARIDGGVLADYEQRRAHLGGVAVGRLEGRRCSGCHLDLSTAEFDLVRATPPEELADCPQCGRILIP